MTPEKLIISVDADEIQLASVKFLHSLKFRI